MGATDAGDTRCCVSVESTQVIDSLHVEPTAFWQWDSAVMVIGLHSQPATQGASAAMFGFRRIPFLLRMSAVDDGTVELSSWSRPERRSLEKPGDAAAMHPSGTCTCGMAHPAGVYNEEAFHYLLSVEYKRFARSQRPFMLALIEEPEPPRIAPAVSTKVFAALAHSLRETDVIGWYREDRVVGALLTHLGDSPLDDVSQLMTDKITRALNEGVSGRSADRLAVKLYQPYEESWS
jgi:hypothetical protein